MLALSLACLILSAIPAGLFCINLRKYTRPLVATEGTRQISVLIPARDEEAAIGGIVASVLASVGVVVEVVVMDDGSTDRTAEKVEALGRSDARVRLERAPMLPRGWNGKQHACWILAQAARYDLFCFVDADVLLAPEALASMIGFMDRGEASLVSGFPRQLTGTWLEWMLLPLIHFVLLGFLPLGRMRKNADPSLAAGCGQFLLVGREAYMAAGGHSAIRETMHDGLRLPRLLRAHGYRTDLADITDLATCRMYRNARQVWQGLAKNATEGLATPAGILPVTALLLLGQVVPFVLVALPVRGAAFWISLGAVSFAWLPRVLGVKRFRQDWRGALLHPVGIVILLLIQWYALVRKLAGGSVTWRSRAYSGE